MNSKLTALIDTEAKALGFDLVRVAMIGGASDPTLQIMAERPDTRQLDLSDCEALSRRVSERLDALEAAGEDPIEGGYRLEVSSPGIDRPLTRLKDYSDWQGHEARLKLAREVDGAKQVTGDIEGLDGETVMISGSKGSRAIPFDAIHSAKLLLTDRLIAATMPLSAQDADEIIEAPVEGVDDLEPQEED
ncbi:ribosome maturation factor RimP [Sphingomonas swuensis]|uniref:Ribosome maturation factor RimP n=1 Tax=Sphingomonas swuensis TaxID=977800 RepID=A0ABP7SMI7_9SPHN